MDEVWKPIPDTIGAFHWKAAEVSDQGRVRWLWSGKYRSRYRYYKTHYHAGQLCVFDPVCRHTQVRKLVLQVFVGHVQGDRVIIHIDGNPTNCALSNLGYKVVTTQTRKQLKPHEKETIRTHWQSARKNNLPITAEILAQSWSVSPRTIYRIIRE